MFTTIKYTLVHAFLYFTLLQLKSSLQKASFFRLHNNSFYGRKHGYLNRPIYPIWDTLLKPNIIIEKKCQGRVLIANQNAWVKVYTCNIFLYILYLLLWLHVACLHLLVIVCKALASLSCFCSPRAHFSPGFPVERYVVV